MKIIFLATILISSSAFATSCYEAQLSTPAGIQNRFCFDSVQIKSLQQGSQLIIHGQDIQGTFATSEMPVAAHPIVLQLKTKINLFSQWDSGCGSGETADLIISAYSNEGESTEVVGALNISVETSTTNDTCHSPPQKETIHFHLMK